MNVKDIDFALLNRYVENGDKIDFSKINRYAIRFSQFTISFIDQLTGKTAGCCEQMCLSSDDKWLKEMANMLDADIKDLIEVAKMYRNYIQPDRSKREDSLCVRCGTQNTADKVVREVQ